jgi:hypothetical protein
VIEVLAELMLERGVPEHIRLDNGPEFVAQGVRGLDQRYGIQDRHHRAGQSLGKRVCGKL